MFLQSHFKFVLLFILFLTSSINGLYGQSDSTSRHLSPYKTEYNPWFKLTKYQRGFESDSLKLYLDALEAKPRPEWTRLDSLNFAETLMKTDRWDMSMYYFDHLNPDFDQDERYWWNREIGYILMKNYDEGIEQIHISSPGIYKFSKIYFLDQFLKAYINNEKDSKWYKTHSVLDWPVDSTLFGIDRSSERYKNEVIIPLTNLDYVLKLLVHFIHSDDPVLANACHEMGKIIESHVALSDAYIAYSIGRQYNNWDKDILESIKKVKAKLSEKKYKIPIFTRYFPLIESWRFEYEVLKEKLIRKTDTVKVIEPVLMLPKPEEKIPFPAELIVIVGIAILMLLIIFFLKSKK